MAASGLAAGPSAKFSARGEFPTDDEPDILDAQGIVDYSMGAQHLAPVTSTLKKIAATDTDLLGNPDADEPDLPDLRVRSAMFPSADAVTGASVEAEDFAEADRLLDVLFAQMAGQEVQGEDDSARATARLMPKIVQQAAEAEIVGGGIDRG